MRSHLFVAVLGALALAACSSQPPPPPATQQFHLGVTLAGTGKGTVTTSPSGISCGTTCNAAFDQGTSVTLTPKAAAGSVFDGWQSGDCPLNSKTPCTLKMDADKSVTAHFTAQSYTVSVTLDGTGSGSVTSSVDFDGGGSTCTTGTCQVTVPANGSLTLTAAAGASSVFNSWGSDCASAGTDTTCTLTVDSDKSASATFDSTAPVTHTLTVTVSGTGSVSDGNGFTCDDSTSPCTHDYTEGTAVTLTATAGTGFDFTGWTEACSDTGGCTVTMDQNHGVTATFTATPPPPQSLSVSVVGSGTVSDGSGFTCSNGTCSQDYASGTSVTLTATAASGYSFTGWTGDCTGTSTCTVTMDAAHSVTATFTATAPSTYTLTVDLSGGGTGTVDDGNGFSCGTSPCTHDYDSGTIVLLTATPAASSVFVGWSGACTNSSGSCLVTMSQARTVTALFVPDTGFYITSIDPPDGASGIGGSTSISVTFSQAADPTTVTSNTDTTCSGTIQVSTSSSNFSTCVPMTSATPTPNGSNTTFTVTPAAPLSGSNLYYVRVTTGVTNTSGQALAGDHNSFFSTAYSAEVSGLTASSIALQSVALSWTNPTDGGFSHARAYYRLSSDTTWTKFGDAPSGATSITVTGLLPDTSYDFQVRAVDLGGNESLGTTLTDVTTAFSGTSADFVAGQTVTGINGSDFTFTWNADSLFFGVYGSAGSILTADQDALWIGVDTDPSSDATGTYSTTVVGSNSVIWPFRADYVIEVRWDATAGQLVASTIAPDSTKTALASATVMPAVTGATGEDEISIPAAAIGNATSIRVAFVAEHTPSGDGFDLAPVNSEATDVWHYHTSLTASLDPGTNAFDPSKNSDTVSALSQAASLVAFTVDMTGQTITGPIQIMGDVTPFDYTLANSNYQLFNDGTHGDADGTDNIYSGAFNLGGSTSLLHFEFANGGTEEPSYSFGVDRVHTLTGSPEVLQTVAFGQVFCASNPFTITFTFTDTSTNGTPAELRGNNVDLGDWTPGAGLAIPDNGGGNVWTVTHTFAAYDIVNGTADGNPNLEWKIGWGAPSDNIWEANNHILNDDVIDNTDAQAQGVVLTWTSNDSTNF